MEQLNFGFEGRCTELDKKKDPLVKLDAIIPWEMFRPRLRSVWREPERERKSNAGRKPWDEIVMFKAIILCPKVWATTECLTFTPKFSNH